MSQVPISGVVLAGGLGRRMGNVDKGLQLLHGKPLTQHVIERLLPQVDELLLNANRHTAQYAMFGHRVIPDLIPDFAGPLAGLHAALSTAKHPLVVTAPCDSPFLPANLVARLLAEMKASQADLVIARSGEQLHPVFCLCQRSLLPQLDAFLLSGERKFSLWFDRQAGVEVDFSDIPEAFQNINTLDELRQLPK
jgi:molybdopterin-guanine dinucleotide biosynthesis protein A